MMQTHSFEQVKQQIIELAYMVRGHFLQATQAFEQKNAELAREVTAQDEEANALTDSVSKHSLSLIALQAPVAGDMRTVGAYLKIVTDLERIGDQAVDMADAVIRMDKTEKELPFFSIMDMTDAVKGILDTTIQAFEKEDINPLHTLNDMDDVIDTLHRRNVEMLESLLEKEPQHFREAIQYIKLLHALERIGDHATNIGEWTLYMKTGHIADLNH
ncbi:PhoU-like phosphate uptake regulator [Aneurinibacillus soli]|uniref:Phosphate-specific transport system accessory protein PhoU n=2 Tax=Aneurinibacillus soli TaxID=1500254 RepID=A0A0U5BD22_9BACL|nr:PhoU-like phosphate uptake regulator [Aneurinibacillus soli]BAU28637.1 hypothetical protein CB4_02812 [Aneurinibacillus soli]